MIRLFHGIALLCLLLFQSGLVSGQETGKVDLPELGMSFVIPEGWIGQMTEQAYVMGSNTEPGLVMMTTHNYSTLDQLRQEARQGLSDTNGTNMQLIGELDAWSDQAIGGEFGGTIEWQQARAYIGGVINGLGQGVSVMVATDVANFGPRYKALGQEIINSFVFYEAEIPAVVDQWKNWFTNAKLTYMDSYYSSGSTSGTGGGYSSETEIHLCGAGFFNYNSSNFMSVDTGGASASSYGGGQGAGTWEVVPSGDGGGVLRLNFYNGEVYEYNLTYEEEKTYLNGNRYFVTYASSGPDYAPNCN